MLCMGNQRSLFIEENILARKKQYIQHSVLHTNIADIQQSRVVTSKSKVDKGRQLITAKCNIFNTITYLE